MNTNHKQLNKNQKANIDFIDLESFHMMTPETAEEFVNKVIELPVLHQGQDSDLKMESNNLRVWQSKTEQSIVIEILTPPYQWINLLTIPYSLDEEDN